MVDVEILLFQFCDAQCRGPGTIAASQQWGVATPRTAGRVLDVRKHDACAIADPLNKNLCWLINFCGMFNQQYVAPRTPQYGVRPMQMRL